MDTALPQKFPFILDRNLAKANCTGNGVCTSCDTVVLGIALYSNEQKARVTGLQINIDYNSGKWTREIINILLLMLNIYFPLVGATCFVLLML